MDQERATRQKSNGITSKGLIQFYFVLRPGGPLGTQFIIKKKKKKKKKLRGSLNASGYRG